MSRLSLKNGAPKEISDEDQCPVCKSSRYLNRNMRFLVNPECYHKMCESCVDRLFSSGPRVCPVAGCNRTLRRQRFRPQTFEDIQIEREVDVRKRVAKVFNRREDEFDSLLDYNNYLNEVEDLTFNLIHKIDVDATEKKLKAYEEANKAAIRENEVLASQETQSLQAQEAAEKEHARLRREAALREAEEERRERAEGRLDVINQLARGEGNADEIARQGRRTLLKKSTARRVGTGDEMDTSDSAGTGLQFKGLRRRARPEPEKPFEPFGEVTVEHEYFVLKGHYAWDFLDTARTSQTYRAGGYDISEYCSRALTDAFAGLAVFVGEEQTAT
ncbi:CDK-activating kinase assembly factor [Eremomyces bilateralis CBS 781.70]|uniref:RNA polymerase II transcription factor B subunit 3 n=1 Tax=Eremomyces bilateralis CBS 781.70 TaxID=1392243 RepID=A0A6G1G2S6_9PEZI|nr:CDK-activating kinase assembly factor [Eremomyces bilateralis CBS 781.70]KAF1812109.1 CDK-activating kinase assembly factor [Eremomyces bilateralis CBS 781.70]